METDIVKDTELHQFHRTLVLNNKPSWSNTNKNFFSFLKTRDQAQYVYTIQTYPTSQTNKSSGTPSYTKTKHYTMDSHYSRQWQTWLLIRQTNHNTYATISPTFLTRKVLTVSKKKKNKRKREWGRRVHQHEAPTPSGSIKNQLPPKKKEGERAEIRQLRIEE